MIVVDALSTLFSDFAPGKTVFSLSHIIHCFLVLLLLFVYLFVCNKVEIVDTSFKGCYRDARFGYTN